MKIAEIKGKGKIEQLTVSVVKLLDERKFIKNGVNKRVMDALVKDDSGEIKMSLFDDQIEQVSSGDNLLIENGFANMFKDELVISTGLFGRMKVVRKE